AAATVAGVRRRPGTDRVGGTKAAGTASGTVLLDTGAP
ncbi:MAG: hypothetical protein JWR62_2465, partial [Modestobacter sp.]|nr:hypothetical protein [Modestobacter sp.]